MKIFVTSDHNLMAGMTVSTACLTYCVKWIDSHGKSKYNQRLLKWFVPSMAGTVVLATGLTAYELYSYNKNLVKKNISPGSSC